MGPIFCVHPLFGGVVLDGSFGVSGALPGPNYMIQAGFGKTVGNNLFHSFNQFNLISSESATFTGPANIQNIVSRVTGGSPSSIDGKISSDIQGANLFFLNPAGVVFGPHAQLDVSGSFAVTTADYVKMVGGGRFNANLGGQDVLTSAPVSAFGFLSAAPAPVSVGNATLSVAPGKSFSVVAGDIALDGSQLFAPGGNVALLSARATGEVSYDDSAPGAHFRDSTLSGFGNITIQSAATVATDSPEGGGTIAIRGRQLLVTGSSTISSINEGANLGGTIELTADVLSVLSGGRVETQATSDGSGGSLSVQATDVTVDGDDGSRASAIRSNAQSGSGDAGNLVVNATTVTLTNGGSISGTSFSAGRGGDVTVIADKIAISGLSAFALPGIYSKAVGSGDAGDIDVEVQDALTVSAGGGIAAQTFSTGHGGNVSVHAGSLSIDRSTSDLGTGIGSDTLPGATGDAGNVIVTVDQALSIIGGGIISSSTFSSGKGGDVSVHAGSLSINGSAISAEAGSATGGPGAVTGDAGNVTVTVDQALSIFGGGVISTNTATSGNGGNVSVHARSLSIDNSTTPNQSTGIFAESNPGSTGNAGNLAINVDEALSIVGGGQISTSTLSSGRGGSVSVHAGSLLIDGSKTPDEFTGIGADSDPEATGNAGDITLTIDRALTVIGHGQISSSTFSSGKGGDLTIHAGSLSIDGSATPDRLTGIVTDTVGSGDAGDLNVVVAQKLNLVGEGEIAVSTFSDGSGGNVRVAANSILIDGMGLEFLTGIDASAAAGTGNGGSVIVHSGQLVLRRGGGISAASFTSGRAGSVFIDTKGSLKLSGGSSIATSSDFSDAGSVDITSGGDVRLNSHSTIAASAFLNGGNIHITAPDVVYLLNSSITAAAGLAGGNITIDPEFIILNNSPISANASAGQGGNINLISSFFLASNSPVTATGAVANGTVNIAAPSLDLGAELITLPSSLVDAQNQLRERCTALLEGDFSSFISLGRGGTEPEPDELQEEF